MQVNLSNKTWELPEPPLNFCALRKAAPHIDAINAGGGGFLMGPDGSMPANAMQTMVELASAMIAVVALAVQRVDPAVTPESLEEALSFADMANLRIAFRDVLLASGLSSGEAEAPATGTPEPQA